MPPDNGRQAAILHDTCGKRAKHDSSERHVQTALGMYSSCLCKFIYIQVRGIYRMVENLQLGFDTC